MTKVPPSFPPEHLLKAGQSFAVPEEKDGFIYFHVYQELMRSLRLKASLRIKALPEKVPFTGEERQLIMNLLKKWGKRKKPLFPKELLDHTPLLEKAMDVQLLAEWLEYASDGRTITAKYLTIGPEGLIWLQNHKELEEEALEEWNRFWFEEFNRLAKHQGLSGVYDDLFRIAMEQKEIIPVTSPRMQAKEKLFFQFLIHLLQMHQNGQTLFDWKEIGSKGTGMASASSSFLRLSSSQLFKRISLMDSKDSG
ncbi:hypothetical protein [Ammoniphilus resinae]|uniref:Uncharacterized protein n=1 Tax=Ammoniphilus resinae TaxID=861532 RepID=A0ABS4GSH4_9BACL|nr:hypothetical protein [Ammoniphilus resinae]MBP1933229.1 hypothetical protein [Ammoniphilus resinae]